MEGETGVEWHVAEEVGSARVEGIRGARACELIGRRFIDPLLFPGMDQRGKSAKILPSFRVPSADFPSHRCSFVPANRLGGAFSIPHRTLFCSFEPQVRSDAFFQN